MRPKKIVSTNEDTIYIDIPMFLKNYGGMGTPEAGTKFYTLLLSKYYDLAVISKRKLVVIFDGGGVFGYAPKFFANSFGRLALEKTQTIKEILDTLLIMSCSRPYLWSEATNAIEDAREKCNIKDADTNEPIDLPKGWTVISCSFDEPKEPLTSGYVSVDPADLRDTQLNLFDFPEEKEEKEEIVMQVNKLNPNARIPTKAYEGDACWDLFSTDEDVYLDPHETRAFSTGLRFNIPNGYYMSIRERSGRGSKGYSLRAGVVDAGYKGEVKVLITNTSDQHRLITNDKAIAQFLIQKVEPIVMVEVYTAEYLKQESERGGKGFGSSDKKEVK